MLKCDSCIESWIFATFFDWLLFIPGLRPLKNNTKFNNSYMQILSKFGVKYNARKIPETPNKTFIVCSSCIHHSQFVLMFALRLRSGFAQRSVFTYPWATCVQTSFTLRSFSVHSPFAYRSSGESATFQGL